MWEFRSIELLTYHCLSFYRYTRTLVLFIWYKCYFLKNLLNIFIYLYIGFEVLTAVVMKSIIF
jgi:hypothetical protein